MSEVTPRCTCRWPGCERETRTGIMCAKHWYTTPKPLRDAIAAEFIPGEPHTPKYHAAVARALEWAARYPNARPVRFPDEVEERRLRALRRRRDHLVNRLEDHPAGFARDMYAAELSALKWVLEILDVEQPRPVVLDQPRQEKAA